MCLAQVVGAVTSQDLAGGFVVPPLLRFVSAEEAYLSNTNGGARMFFNIEDHLSWNTGVVNARSQARILICASSEEGGILRLLLDLLWLALEWDVLKSQRHFPAEVTSTRTTWGQSKPCGDRQQNTQITVLCQTPRL